MNKNSTIAIRKAFLDYFNHNGHQIIDSSSLVPNNDSTLLFTNAGMNQFKDIFLGQKKYNYSRVTTVQRCVRAGGKHNDLEKVGYTPYHHTFFEMLGNFSFNDYSKKEAILFAWELLTSEFWFKLPKNRLLVTVYETDNESYDIWSKKIGIDPKNIIKIGDNKGIPYMSDNFWQMGDTGPCGPCSEIFYDHGDSVPGNVPGNYKSYGNRYIEIWNIVSIEFNRLHDGTLLKLSKPSIDTGMGLERISAILQNVHSNYKTDLFQNLIYKIAHNININNLNDKSLYIIADHIRSCAFLIADGVVPSNVYRGYVLRRIIRRAIRHGSILGIKKPFFYKLVTSLIEVMGDAGKILLYQKKLIEDILKTEEKQFYKTLQRGLTLLNEELLKLDSKTLSGKIIFRLYDTFGFPVDIIEDVCYERGIKIDRNAFEEIMKQQRQQARKSSSFITNNSNIVISDNNVSIFKGYNKLNLTSIVIGIYVSGKSITNITENQDNVIIILNETPFYSEGGGQIGDTGFLKRKGVTFKVYDTQKNGTTIYHFGKLIVGSLNVGDKLKAIVDDTRRKNISLNHSATHLLHKALCQILGTHILQKGSLINEKYLRFDFSHFNAMTLEETYQVENIVNIQIRRNLLIKTNIMDFDIAKSKGISGLFNKKYNKLVRVLTIGDFSIELCGGTHVTRTGDIGLFKILTESSIATGIRRIEAITGETAFIQVNNDSKQLFDIKRLVKANNNNLNQKISNLINHVRFLEKELQQLQYKQVIQEKSCLVNKLIKLKEIHLLVSQLDSVNHKILRMIIDDFKNQFNPIVIVLSTVINSKVFLISGVTENLTNRINAIELIKYLANQINGKGGGRSDMAQAIGTNILGIKNAMASVQYWISNRL